MYQQHDRTDHSSPTRRGFTLIEAILVLAVFAIAATMAIPLADRYLTQRLRQETRDEMLQLREAIGHYFEDAGAFPAALEDLEERPIGVNGWQGPYVTRLFNDDQAALDDYLHDGWHRLYAFSVTSPTTRNLSSVGVNGIDEGGTGDDIVLPIEVASVLRKRTVTALEVINVAVQAYNRENLPSSPLPTSYASLLSTLRAGGYLPPAGTMDFIETDAWGQPYVTDGSPVIAVLSAGSPD
ncbi:MAG: type II secretion system protein [Planctomycetota bacterium]